MIDWLAVKKAADLSNLISAISEEAAPEVDPRMKQFLPTSYAPVTSADAERLTSYNGLNELHRNMRGIADESMFLKDLRFTRDGNGEMYLGKNHINDLDGYYVYDNGQPVFDNSGSLMTSSGIPFKSQSLGMSKKINEYPDFDKFADAYQRAWQSIEEGDDLDYWRNLDRNGYLIDAGIVNPGDPNEKQMSTYRKAFYRLKYPSMYNAYAKYLQANYPDDFAELRSSWGPFTDFDALQENNQVNTEEQRQSRHEMNAARRWGNSMINLTPQQYAYYNAKQNYNANPGDTRYNLMMQAKKPLKPVDLQNIKKYTVQQRMMNTPQPNGLPKTPQMLQREWQDENKRRQTVARDMYKNEVKGLKNRTGVNAVPTMTQPWGGR